MSYPLIRPRRVRKSDSVRALVTETNLSPADFIVPLFVVEGEKIKEEISSMPNYYRYSLDMLLGEVQECAGLGLKSVLLFAKVPDERKDNMGTEAINPDGLMQRAIKAIKKTVPEMYVMSDVAMDPYSEFGHDGIVKEGEIINDETVELLGRMSVSHAEAGVDMVAPSDMMDGRILGIRGALEDKGFINTGIMAYSAKYASCLYGPFRDALDSAPGFGDKKTYQMNPANKMEAIREVALDIEEGADIVMVKPGIFYLDIINEVKMHFKTVVSAYQVSGEYAMIKAAVANGWMNEQEAVMESLISFKRAGADLIATYFAKDAVKYLQQ